YARIDNGLIRTAPFNEIDATPSQLRWSPIPVPQGPTDFIEGIVTIGGNGDVAAEVGMAAHIYAANRSMTDRYFYNADGEMLILPQLGRARFVTERLADLPDAEVQSLVEVHESSVAPDLFAKLVPADHVAAVVRQQR
ncbi:MAG: homogentisate 1,2-dioxygenase, partial [Candidatus Hydrogenedentales bacterium]